MSRLDRRIVLEVFYILAGGAFFILGMTGMLDSFWTGLGAALVALGVLRLIQIGRYKNDEDYKENVDIANSDERIRFITSKAKSVAFYTSVLLEAAAVIVLRIMKLDELSTFAGLVLCVQIAVYYVAYLVLRNRY